MSKLQNKFFLFLSFCLGTHLANAQVTIDPQPDTCPYEIQATLFSPTCPGGDDGSIQLAVSSSVDGTITYEWPQLGVLPAETDAVVGLHSGEWQCNITDGAGCTETFSFFLEDAVPVDFILLNDPVLCNGESNGIIQVATAVDNPNYSYALSNSATTQNSNVFENLPAGEYLVYVYDENNCESTDLAFVEEPDELILGIQRQNVTCPGGNDGRIVVQPDGGVGDYRVKINGVDYGNINQFDQLPANEYEVTLTDANLCSKIEMVYIQEPSAPQLDAEVENVTCPGGNDAVVNIVIIDSGVASPVDYEFSIDDLSYLPDSTFTGLEAGTYTVSVRNPDGCIFRTAAIIVEEPVEPQVTTTVNSVTCPGEEDASVDIVIIDSGVGAPGTYEYSLDGITYSLDSTFSNLSPGEYTPSVRNADGCIFQTAFTIYDIPEPEVSAEISGLTCFGDEDAVIDIVIIDSGVASHGGYEYSIDGINFSEDSTFNDLGAGTYQVSVMNENGCLFETTAVIAQPEVPEISSAVSEITCPGDDDATVAIVIIDSGVATPIDYEYSLDGINYSFDSIFTGLGSGTYNVSIRSSLGCFFETEAYVHESIAPTLATEVEDVSCPGDSDATLAIVIIDSGVASPAPFEYSLDNQNYSLDSVFTGLDEGVYTVYVRNQNGCVFETSANITQPGEPGIEFEIMDQSCDGVPDGSFIVIIDSGIGIIGGDFDFSLDNINFQPDSTFTNLVAGEYTVYVRSEGNCLFMGTVIIGSGSNVEADLTVGHETCTYGNAWLACSPFSGTAPFSYDWSTGQRTPVLQELSAGRYSVTVSDSNGCTFEETIIVENEPEPDVLADLNHVSCFEAEDGKIDLTINSLSFDLKYIWSNGANTKSISDLKAGSYAVTVTDDNQCKTTEDYQIVEPPAIQIKETIIQDGVVSTIAAFPSGGIAPYQYSWSTGGTGSSVSNLKSGLYYLTVTDASNCQQEAEFRVDNGSVFDNSDILIFPNPADEFIYIGFNFTEEKRIKVEIIDELGRVLYWTPEQTITEDLKKFDISHFSTALYFLKIYSDDSCLVKKFVKYTE